MGPIGRQNQDESASPAFLLQQRFVDRERRLRPFAGGNDHELQSPARIPRHIQARNARGRALRTLNAIVSIEFAPELFAERRALTLRRRKEERAARDDSAGGKTDGAQLIAFAFETLDRILDHGDPGTIEPFALFARKLRLSIRAQDQVRAPMQDFERKVDGLIASAINSERFIAMLPAIAIWAMMDRPPIKLVESSQRGTCVDQSGREKKSSRCNGFAGFHGRHERSIGTSYVHDLYMTQFHGIIRRQLLPADLKEFCGRYSIAGKKAVHRLRSRVPRMSVIQHNGFPAASSQDERCAETGRTSTYNDDIKHADKSWPPRRAVRRE